MSFRILTGEQVSAHSPSSSDATGNLGTIFLKSPQMGRLKRNLFENAAFSILATFLHPSLHSAFWMATQIAHDFPDCSTKSPGKETWITAGSVAPPPCHLTILILVHCMAIEIPYDQCYGLFNSFCYLHKHRQICFFIVP